MDYRSAWDAQLKVQEAVAAGGLDTLILVEHPKVMTLGASFHEGHLLHSIEALEARGIEVVRTDRGGDVTYHGPGQLVIYPIFDLTRHGKDLHKWMRDLEETQLHVLSALGIEGRRFPPHTGAWILDRKVAAIGVKIKRWISTHGIALNCESDLSDFELIVPCGIRGYGVTSLTAELGRDVSPDDVMPLVIRAFEDVFGLDFRVENRLVE